MRRARKANQNDEGWQTWLAFRDFAYLVLEHGGHAEALALVRERLAGNEPHLLAGGPCRSVTGADTRLWILTETVWAGLHDYPAAKKDLEDTLDDLQRHFAEERAREGKGPAPAPPDRPAEGEPEVLDLGGGE